MRDRLFALILCLTACFVSAAHAQTAVYGGVSVANYCYKTGYGNVACKDDTVGFTGGATYLFPSSSRLKAGVDARFDGSPGNKGGEAGLFAVRIAFVPRQKRVSPYFQIGGGFLHTTYPIEYCPVVAFGSPIGSCSVTYSPVNGGAVELAAGFNVRLTRHAFIRPLELMSSGYSSVGHASIGAALGYQF